MNPVLEEMLRTGISISESGKQLPVSSHITTEEGRFLQGIVEEVKPGVSLEIGLAYGVSALFICEALARQPAAKHIVIDPHQFQPTLMHKNHFTFEGSGLFNLKKAGYDRFLDFRDATSQLALPQLVSEGVQVDFAFIDGWHTFDFALVDFFYVDRLLRCGGVVVLDDTDFPSVWKLCRYIVTNRAYKVVRCLASTTLPTARLPKRLAIKYSRKLWRDSRGMFRRDGLKPYSRCIAFKKEADDSRSWDFHEKF